MKMLSLSLSLSLSIVTTSGEGGIWTLILLTKETKPRHWTTTLLAFFGKFKNIKRIET